ncbi:MAG: SGNH/GDSL hydrolase family protein [Syntrophales bacterium]
MKAHRTIGLLRSGRPVTLAALGDSLTRGWMVRKGYLDYLSEMLRREYPACSLRIVNEGLPGDTADCGLYRIETDILEESPDCVLVQYAINDASLGFTTDQFKRTIRGIIEKVRRAGEAEVVLVTSSFIGDNRENAIVEEYYKILADLGTEEGLPVARVHEHWKRKVAEGVDWRSLVQFDFVHPTTEGYRYMAEAVMEIFREDQAEGLQGISKR